MQKKDLLELKQSLEAKLDEAIKLRDEAFINILKTAKEAKDLQGNPLDSLAMKLLAQDNAKRIKTDYSLQVSQNLKIRLVILLKGAYIYGHLLHEALETEEVPHEMDFLQTSRYSGTGTAELKIQENDKFNPAHQHVLIVDDVYDKGDTLSGVVKYVNSFSPASVRKICMVDKIQNRKDPLTLDYEAFKVSAEAFLLGGGMDWYDQGRDIKGIYVIDPASKPSAEIEAIIKTIPKLNRKIRECNCLIKIAEDKVEITVDMRDSLSQTFLPPPETPPQINQRASSHNNTCVVS